jgi:DNA-binding transcriptional LysR family regulator
MNYTLNQLKIYLKVVQSKSITRAADELNLTQPAVSIQLKNFQAQFEIPLIEIIGKKVYVTDFGKEIAQSAEGIIEQVYAINFKTSAYKGQLFVRLKVSIVSTGKYVLPYFLNGFLRLNPGVELEMDVTNRDKVLESLDQNEVDFSLVSLEIDRPNYEYLPLLQNDLYFIGNPETANMLPELGQVNSKSELPFIFREKGSGTRRIMENYLKKHLVSAPKKLELTSNEAVKQAVIAGLGYSIMPLIGIKNELKNGSLIIIPQKELPITTEWKLVWHKEKTLTPIANAFIKYVTEHKESIKEKYFF